MIWYLLKFVCENFEWILFIIKDSVKLSKERVFIFGVEFVVIGIFMDESFVDNDGFKNNFW